MELDKPGTQARVLLIDFSKAFDHIDHAMLLEKLQARGVPSILLRWTYSFLQNRQQCVKVGGLFSDWLSPNGGVPQGTLAGPLH